MIKIVKTKFVFLVFIFVSFMYASAQEPRFSWKRIGPDGGNVSSFLDLDSVLLVGTTSGGMYRSTDNGQTWNNIRVLPLESEEGVVQQFATAQGRVFSIVGNQLRRASGLYVSDDKGLTWKANPITNQSFVRIHLLEATNDSLLFITTSFSGAGGDPMPKTLRSEDGGRSWQVLESLLGSVQDDFPLLYTSNNIIRIGQILLYPDKFQGLMRSRDNGRTWQVSPFPIFARNRYNITQPRQMSLVVRQTELFMGIDSNVYVSRDSGLSWQKTNFEIPQITAQRVPFRVSSLIQRNDTLFVSVNADVLNTPGFLAIANPIPNGIILITGDRGVTWTPRLAHQMIPNALPLQLLATKRSIFLIPQDREVFANTNGLWRSDNNGLSWQSVHEEIEGFSLTTLVPTRNRLFAFNRFEARCFSISGMNVSRVVSSMWTSTILEYFSLDTLLFASSGIVTFRSNDNARSWHIIRTQDSNFAAGIRYPLVVDGVIVALNQQPSPSQWSRSTDTGKSWKPILSMNTSRSLNIAGVALDTASKILYIRQNDSVFRSLDLGLTWQFSTDEAAFNRALSVRIGNVFIQPLGNLNSIFSYSNALYSRDSGRTFTSSFLGLPTTLRILQFIRQGNNLYVATSRGVYVADATTDIRTQPSNIASLSLMCSPNPANDIVQIRFYASAFATTEIDIVDVLGRSVIPLRTEQVQIGEHVQTISTKDIPTGFYLVRLTIKDNFGIRTETIRFHIMR